MESEHPLPEDSLKKIVKIMEYIEIYHAQKTEDDIKRQFGEEGMFIFSRYCLGGDSNRAYADTEIGTIDGKKVSVYRLTQTGVRKLHELRGILAQEKRDKLIADTNRAVALFIALQCSLLLWGLIKEFFPLKVSTGLWGNLLLILFILGIVFSLPILILWTMGILRK